jgi:hypothetical protein
MVTRTEKLTSDALLKTLDKLPIRYTKHALERLEEREILQADVTNMLRGKTKQRFHHPSKDKFDAGVWKYRIHGVDVDGHKIAAAVVIEESAIVVTVFSREEI